MGPREQRLQELETENQRLRAVIASMLEQRAETQAELDKIETLLIDIQRTI